MPWSAAVVGAGVGVGVGTGVGAGVGVGEVAGESDPQATNADDTATTESRTIKRRIRTIHLTDVFGRRDQEGMTASASISTSISGLTSPLTPTIVYRRADVREHFTMCPADLLPVGGDVHDIHACSHDIVNRGAGLHERGRDVLERLLRLDVCISNANDTPIRSSRGRPRDPELVADADHP